MNGRKVMQRLHMGCGQSLRCSGSGAGKANEGTKWKVRASEWLRSRGRKRNGESG